MTEGERSPLVFDSDWDEEERLADWLDVVAQGRDEGTPAVLAGALVWDAWESTEPLQHQAWLGTLLVAALLRERGKVTSHVFSLNAGLKIIPRERRRGRDRTTRPLVSEAAATGLKEIDRLVMAQGQMERRLRNRRSNSSLPAPIELVLARPVVSAGLIARSSRSARRAQSHWRARREGDDGAGTLPSVGDTLMVLSIEKIVRYADNATGITMLLPSREVVSNWGPTHCFGSQAPE